MPEHDDFQLLEIVRPTVQGRWRQHPPKHEITEREKHEACRVRESLFTPLGRIRERHHRDDLGAQCERHRMPTAFESAGLPQVA